MFLRMCFGRIPSYIVQLFEYFVPKCPTVNVLSPNICVSVCIQPAINSVAVVEILELGEIALVR